MTIQDVAYTHTEAEFDELRELLLQSYAHSPAPLNWRLALLENWYYASRYLEPREYFTSRVRLWRDETGELVSFLIRYYTMTYPQVRPGYRRLEDRMLEWVERHWAGDEACIKTLAYEHDSRRQALLAQRGYERVRVTELVRLYNLARDQAEPVLPPGFRIATVAETGDVAGRIALENAAWGHTFLDGAWFRGKSSAPHYSLDWDLVVLSPEGQPVAACLVWIDPHNRTAEIDPLGTHPAFRRRGLARALLAEGFRRMQAAGLHTLYIASAHDNHAANRLYESLQPRQTYPASGWIKRLDRQSVLSAPERPVHSESLPDRTNVGSPRFFEGRVAIACRANVRYHAVSCAGGDRHPSTHPRSSGMHPEVATF
jgi:ribosomal protein S18 acetylase RimI-like enzyme